MSNEHKQIVGSDAKIIRDTISLINERSMNYTDIEYRRLLRLLIKRLYTIRNFDYKKKPAKSDFTSIINPKRLFQSNPSK